MHVVSVAEMQALDNRTIQELGIPSLVLMERASSGIYAHLKNHFNQRLNSQKPVLILVGTGNNGGDGLVIARLLHCDGYPVQILQVGNDARRSPDNKHQFEITRRLGIAFEPIDTIEQLKPHLDHVSLVVDALFGVGLSRPLEGIYAEIVNCINQLDYPVVSVDIPSGVDGNTGMVLGSAFNASLTVTCAFPKYGLLMDPTLDKIGQLEVVDIGIPPSYTSELKSQLITRHSIAKLLPAARPAQAHKGTYGKLAIVAGSLTMSGAAVLAARAALASGVGIVYLMVPQSIHTCVASQIPGVLTIPLPEQDGQICKESLSPILDTLNSCQSLVIGPGLGLNIGVKKLLEQLIPKIKIPCLFDADALNHLSSLALTLNEQCVLTPHVGEMSRLIDCSTQDIQSNRVAAIHQAVHDYKCHVVLKGAVSIVSEVNSSLYFNTRTGNPALARGGSGDILSGLIGGFLAQRMPPVQAAQLAVYWHGLAGDKAAEKKPQANVLMEDVLNALPLAYREMQAF